MSVAEMFRVLLPRFSVDGALAMISGYFDDSGTHDQSEIIVYGGLIGNEEEWLDFESAWVRRLAAPLPGKPAISRFHTGRCLSRQGKEFEHYSRGEAEKLTLAFAQIISDTSLSGYSSIIEKQVWDALIVGDMQRVLGDAERSCVTNCIMKSIEWTEQKTQSRRLALVFDNRPHRQEANEKVFSIYQRWLLTRDKKPGALDPSIAFEASACFKPLEGADVIAWAAYQRGRVQARLAQSTPFLNELFSILGKNKKINNQIALRPQIEKIVEKMKSAPLLKVNADFIDSPRLVFPPTIVARSEGGEIFRLEPTVSAAPQWFLDLPQKRWCPCDPSSAPTQLLDSPLLRVAFPKSKLSEGN